MIFLLIGARKIPEKTIQVTVLAVKITAVTLFALKIIGLRLTILRLISADSIVVR